MTTVYDTTDLQQRESGLRHAADAVRRGELVVLPTDTVYGIGADAFSAEAVADLLAAKGRGRSMPPPVLVADVRTLDALATDVSDDVRALVERFWPGALTVICNAQPSLAWDLGDTEGTVALRMPDHELALELLRATGPMAVSSANLTGQPAARTAADARDQLGDAVSAYLEAGRAPGGTPSTIVDATEDVPRLARIGAISLRQLREVVPGMLDLHGNAPEGPAEPSPRTEATDLVEPTQPAEPTQPGEWTEPAGPNQPAEPTQPAEPIHSAEPNQPAEPTELAEPVERDGRGQPPETSER